MFTDDASWFVVLDWTPIAADDRLSEIERLAVERQFMLDLARQLGRLLADLDGMEAHHG